VLKSYLGRATLARDACISTPHHTAGDFTSFDKPFCVGMFRHPSRPRSVSHKVKCPLVVVLASFAGCDQFDASEDDSCSQGSLTGFGGFLWWYRPLSGVVIGMMPVRDDTAA
jgi:hypothetical protein